MITTADVDIREITKDVDVKVFKNKEFGKVRAVEIGGEPFLVGRDVAERLGYAKPQNAIATHIDEDDTLKQGITDSLGRRQQTIVINESGLYSLILSSKLPSAKKFKRWVTKEVLPAIRKTGMYATEELLNNPDLAIKAFTALKEEREKNKVLEFTNKKQEQIIGELKPKADYVDRILKSKGLVTITQISKDYGMSGQAMNSLLYSLKVQYKQGNQWLLYANHHSKGYTHSETINITRSDGSPDVKMNTKWTQKGRLFLYELLKAEGYAPVIEQKQEA